MNIFHITELYAELKMIEIVNFIFYHNFFSNAKLKVKPFTS